MRCKRPAAAAWAMAGVLTSLGFSPAGPGTAAASLVLPQGGIVVAGSEPPPPPPPPPVPTDGVLWTDDFEDGSTEGWVVGQLSPLPPTNVPDGGPRGAGDSYLRLRSNGEPNLPGGRLVALNRNGLWTQDLHARGVNRIEMDVRNMYSFVSLQLRLAVYTLGPNGFASARPITIRSDGQWQHVVFDFREEAMAMLGTMSYEDVLDHFEEIRILHSATPSLRGDPLFAEVHVDNIKVVAAPEPSSAVLAGAVLSYALLRRRRRR